MKKNIIIGGLALAMMGGLFAFSTSQSSITGKVSPADGVESVWAISGTDSVKSGLNAGSFTLSVKSGTYKVIIDAKDPYKDVLLDNIAVKDDQPADIGEIVLQK